MPKVHGDEVGLFWQQPIVVGNSSAKGKKSGGGGKKSDFRMAPPPTDYELPEFFQFSDSPVISLDIEGKDPNLLTKGPGVRRGDGFITGISVRTQDGRGDYYPIAHKDAPNLPRENVIRWLTDQLAFYKGEIRGANLLYDMDWLHGDGVVSPFATFNDVQWAEALIDETARSYKLEKLAQKYLGEGKVTDELKRLYGADYITNMDRVHPAHAREYGLGDVDLPLQIAEKQKAKLTAEGLDEVWDMEQRLFHMVLYMHNEGVRVNIEGATEFEAKLQSEMKRLQDEIKHMSGVQLGTSAASSEVARMLDKMEIPYPKTDKGNPSIVNAWLQHHEHPIMAKVASLRQASKTDGTFMKGYLLDKHINGRLYTLFHPLRSDENGTVSGRFSSSLPNLQNIPARDPVLGPLIRGMFLPDEGCKWWSKDYSQVEYRLLVHFAVAIGAEGAVEAMQRYRNDPTTDFHQFASEVTGLPRKGAKNINFGVVYGMGAPKMAADLGVELEEGKRILNIFHTEMPFAKKTGEFATKRAANVGYVRTLMKRRRRFTSWESAKWYKEAEKQGLIKEHGASYFYPVDTREEAVEKWGSAKRAGTHKGLNSVLQGSAADVMKKAMVQAWEAGCFDNTGLTCPLTVHDELDGSVDTSSKVAMQALDEVHKIMENTVTLNVPLLVDGAIGNNWAEAK